MIRWLAMAWLTWPLYRIGIRRPYGWASGKVAAAMLREVREAIRVAERDLQSKPQN
jgi:hypothetical protein